MSETQAAGARRAVPNIVTSPALLAAAAALSAAKATYPDALRLVTNPYDVQQVRDALQAVGNWFADPTFFFSDDTQGERGAADCLILLATTLREHLAVGNTR